MSTTPVPVMAQLFAQVSPERIQRFCGAGDNADPICTAAIRATNNGNVAQLAGTVVPALLKIVLIVVLAYVANRILKRAIKRFTRKLAGQGIQRLGWLKDRAPLADTSPMDLSRAAMRTETIGAVLNSVTTFVVWTLAVFMVLGAIGIQLGPLLAGAGIAGVALGFGAQNMVKDFLGGILIILEDQYGIGDVVDLREAIGTPGIAGSVEAISLRTTRLRDVEGTVWYVPNGQIRSAGNKSQQWARSLLDIGVAYDTDVAKASGVLKRVADGLWADSEFGPDIIEEPEVWGLERFDADQVILRMVLKVKPARQWAVNRELRARIKTAFDGEGIEIPFPQRTVWMRSDDRKPTEPAPAGGAPPSS
ncbi:MAG: mechanosensitive ion channel family protein [Euzebyales bacterium]|nr:mechanosensitive ion channel family protein [Euzebyales bacterium]MBA3621890.1 mechanosensitive ion channel family protein [Euzebyales bacterium]